MLQNKKKNNNKRGGKAVVHRGLIWQTASRVSALVIGLSESWEQVRATRLLLGLPLCAGTADEWQRRENLCLVKIIESQDQPGWKRA